MIKEEVRLKKAVNFVRRTFFSRWDRNHNWIFSLNFPQGEEGFYHGKCDNKNKAIYLAFLPENDIELHMLLIHEICHCFYPGHGKSWQQRFMKAAIRANAIGQKKLAEKIVEEIHLYQSSPKVTAHMIYTQVHDWVLDMNGEISFEQIREALAQEYGGYEIPNKYKQLPKIYELAVKEAKTVCRFVPPFK